MNLNWLTFRDLEYIVAVADTLHFGKAAKLCFVTQPSLSAQIKKVEEQLEVQLFERTNRRVALTSTGGRIVEQARFLLEESKRLGELAKKSIPLNGKIRIGMIASVSPYLAPYFLAPLRKTYPKCELSLKEGLTEELLEDLKKGVLDYVVASSTFPADGFRIRPLYEEEFILLAPKGAPILSKDALKPTDLKAEEMVLLEEGHCLSDQTLEFCPAKSRKGAFRVHVASMSTLMHLVAAGLGYTLVPRLASELDPKLKELLGQKSFESARFVGRDVILVTREKWSGAEEAQLLVQLIQKSLEKAPVKISK